MNSTPDYIPVPPERMEEYSSAATLSDMEIFIFPRLLYPLVLANMMSPSLWRWRDDPWFARFDRLSPYRRILRLKQFIMDHYTFNLDLETWGLTTQRRELERFARFMPAETIARSNALFGYHGDRFYFDLDIRRHFGLDKYSGDTIPYWKTETLEAMDAFRHRPGHSTGAGECVSLSTLYAAALHVHAGIPLDDIYLLATPLHSQNFVDLGDGILTNNRRLVTKTMWYNGTALSAKARRALEHERLTIVSHLTGHIHTVYPEATISPDAYARFKTRLRAFATTDPTAEILYNFLRQAPHRQPCFQIETTVNGKHRWLPAEKAYAFENSGPYKISDDTRDRLLAGIDEDEFFASPLPDRIPLNRFDAFFREHPIRLDNPDDRKALAHEFDCFRTGVCEIADELAAFCRLEPRWPDADGPAKTFVPTPPLELPEGPDFTRENLINALQSQRKDTPTADLAFYVWRDLSRTDPRPFLKAAIERSPVCAAATRATDTADLPALVRSLPDESIYGPGPRTAQPDETWNAQRGDGLEKALLLAALLHARAPSEELTLETDGCTARLRFGAHEHLFPSTNSATFSASWPV